MASQAYIIAWEERIMAAQQAAVSLYGSLAREGQYMGNGACYPMNRDCWATVALNARAAARALDSLAVEIDRAREAAPQS